MCCPFLHWANGPLSLPGHLSVWVPWLPSGSPLCSPVPGTASPQPTTTSPSLTCSLWLPSCLLWEAPCLQRPTASTSSSSQPGLPRFPPRSAGYHWFSTSWEWPELFCLLGRAETRKEGKIIQMSSWIELLKAASSLPQRGHTAKEGEKFGVVSTAGRVGRNGCGWPRRLSQPS